MQYGFCKIDARPQNQWIWKVKEHCRSPNPAVEQYWIEIDRKCHEQRLNFTLSVVMDMHIVHTIPPSRWAPLNQKIILALGGI